MRLTRRQVIAGAGLAGLGAALPVSAAPAPVQVKIRDFVFDPEVVTIRAGETVEWINADFAPHTASDDNGAWDTGELGKDDRMALAFESPGEFTYFCAFHPHMKARVTVTG